MSELKRNITTIAEQDEHQVLNQASTGTTVSATTCESIYLPQSNCSLLEKQNSTTHNNSSIEASHLLVQSDGNSNGNRTPSIDGCNIRHQFDSTARTLFKESTNSIELSKEVTRAKKKKVFRIKESQSSASTSSSIEYKRIDENEQDDFDSEIRSKSDSSRPSSIALLVIMILIYYSLLFLLLFKFHSTLVLSTGQTDDQTNETAQFSVEDSSSVKYESTSHTHTPIDPMSMSIFPHSMAHRSDDPSSDDSFATDSLFDREQEDKHLKKGSIQLALATDSLDDRQGDSVVQISDSLLDDHLARGEFNSQYFDISLDGANDQLHLYWLPDYKRKQVLFQVRYIQHTKYDWLAIGFSNYGNITNADLCILWLDHHSQFHFEVSLHFTLPLTNFQLFTN